MYNEELKIRFIKDKRPVLATEKLIKTVFNTTDEYEKKHGADVCTLSGNDMDDVVNALCGSRARNRTQKISVLREYCSWCVVSKVPGAKELPSEALMTLGLGTMRKTTVSSPAHLQQYLDRVFRRNESDATIETVYRCYCWMAYGGIPEQEIERISCGQIDLDRMVIHYEKREIPIYHQAALAFRNAATLKWFRFEHAGYDPIERKRTDGDSVIRGFRPVTYLTMRSKLSKMEHQAVRDGLTDIVVGYSRLWLSGLFYRVYEAECIDGIEYNFLDTAEEVMAGKEYNLQNRTNSITSIQSSIAKEYRQDYERWKLAWF